MLEAAGFRRISETKLDDADDFKNLQPGGRYYFTRNQSTIFALAVGGKWRPGNGLAMLAAHTDSPCFRVWIPFLCP